MPHVVAGKIDVFPAQRRGGGPEGIHRPAGPVRAAAHFDIFFSRQLGAKREASPTFYFILHLLYDVMLIPLGGPEFCSCE